MNKFIEMINLVKYDTGISGFTNIGKLIEMYFRERELLWPDVIDSILFVDTEIAEVKELLLAKKNYVRNNPQNKEIYSNERFEEELGDVLFMVIVAGIVSGTNPMFAMLNKMQRKIEEKYEAEK